MHVHMYLLDLRAYMRSATAYRQIDTCMCMWVSGMGRGEVIKECSRRVSVARLESEGDRALTPFRPAPLLLGPVRAVRSTRGATAHRVSLSLFTDFTLSAKSHGAPNIPFFLQGLYVVWYGSVCTIVYMEDKKKGSGCCGAAHPTSLS